MGDGASVFVIDDDEDLALSIARLLNRNGHAARAHASAADFIESYSVGQPTCVLSDMMMGRVTGFDLADQIRSKDPAAAIIFMTAWPSTTAAVDAVRRHGGIDYLEKPINEERLLAAVAEGLLWSKRRREAYSRIAALTRREREVFQLLVQGLSNKAVAACLGLSPKTVEDHRASIMSKTSGENLADLIAIAHRLD